MDNKDSGRSFIRYQAMHWNAGTTLSFGSTSIPVTVLDESIEGLGVRVNQPVALQGGEIVEIGNPSFARSAQVIHCAMLEDKSQRIGLHWLASSDYRYLDAGDG
jgi:hypothetical protein